jgi:predicted amidohydrolase
MTFRLALAQMQVCGGDLEGNIARAESMVAAAALGGADLVVLPETMDVGWADESARRCAKPIPDGATCLRLRLAAARHRIYICVGLTERDRAQVFNTAVLIDRDGIVLGMHRKLNEMSIGQQCYDQGDRLSVIHTELGAIGIMICADGLAQGQVISRSLGYMGADIILSPSAWLVSRDHDPIAEPYGKEWLSAYIPVAREFSLWIAGVSNVGEIATGPCTGQFCIGQSLVIDADGREALHGPYGVNAEALLHVTVTPKPRPARGEGWECLHQSQPTPPSR